MSTQHTRQRSRLTLAVLVAATAGLAACSPTVQEAETTSTRYEKITIPAANGVTGADYVEVAKFRFAIGPDGQRIGKRHPQTGEQMSQVVGVEYAETFTEPGVLKLMGIVVPGLLQIGGQWFLSEHCDNCGGGGGGNPIYLQNQNFNQNDNTTSVTGSGSCSGGDCASLLGAS